MSPCLILPNGKVRVLEVGHYDPLLAAVLDQGGYTKAEMGTLSAVFPSLASGARATS